MIKVKSARELERMRDAGRITALAHALVRRLVEPGIRTIDIDKAVRDLILEHDAEPAFFGYKGFPGNICTSVNEEVVHGIPGSRRLKEGDIISVDIGVRYKGYHGDAAQTLPVGRIPEDADRLIRDTEGALHAALRLVAQGVRLSTVSRTIQSYAEARGYGVVREYVGHGIGRDMHEDPQVPNYVDGVKLDVYLKAGMCLAIEPMLNLGTARTRQKKNGWTVVTEDGKLSAHAEHTVAVTETGVEILTRLPDQENSLLAPQVRVEGQP